MNSSSEGPRAAVAERFRRAGLAWGERNYDQDRRLVRFANPSRAGHGAENHMTRDSLYFARILLDAGDPAEVSRACGIIEAVLATQVKREGSRWRGNFPWAAEDGEERIWDPNWACFIAQTTLEILRRHGARLPAATVSALEGSLALCAEFDLARWVSPAYTNIALLTALCLAAGGDRLRDRRFAEAGRAKLREVMECVAATGSFDEFNSPTYIGINMRALAGLLEMLPEGGDRWPAEELWRLQWSSLLAHVHPPTGQIAGPWARAYARDLLRGTHGLAKFHLAREFGGTFASGAESEGGSSDMFPALMADDPPCPVDLRGGFLARRLPLSVVEVMDSADFSVPFPASRRRPPFWSARGTPGMWAELVRSKGRPSAPAFRGARRLAVTHLAEGWCLGTMSAGAMGFQAHPLVAHWPGPAGSGRANYLAALALRRVDEKYSFLSGGVLCHAQEGSRALGLLRFELGEEDASPPCAEEAFLAFAVNRDTGAEVRTGSSPGRGNFTANDTVVFEADGICAAVRFLAAEVPGAKASGTIGDGEFPYGPPSGETAALLRLAPLVLKPGDEAWAAFAVEVAAAGECGGPAGLAERVRAAPIRAVRRDDGLVRLEWEGVCWLETSVKVMDINSFLTPEGEVRVGGTGAGRAE